MRTMYTENERELQRKHLSNFGLNPYACDLLIRSYLKNIAPLPIILDYFIDVEDQGRHQVELTIKTPGYLGGRRGNANLLDTFGLRLFCRSYYEDVKPYPVSFLYNKVEVHLRTPGVSEHAMKNIARDVFNPTV